jgi:hypothetical protein
MDEGGVVKLQILFSPISRANDPLTSVEAEDYINASGSRQRQIEIAAELVKQYPGSTCRELAEKGMDNERLHKRIPDAVVAGLVTRGAWRQCFVTGRKAMTFWPARG